MNKNSFEGYKIHLSSFEDADLNLLIAEYIVKEIIRISDILTPEKPESQKAQ